MNKDPLNDQALHDTEAEEAINWYQHYMNVAIEHLIGEAISRWVNQDEVNAPIKVALERREDEVMEFCFDCIE